MLAACDVTVGVTQLHNKSISKGEHACYDYEGCPK